jgi:hypothetical protein
MKKAVQFNARPFQNLFDQTYVQIDLIRPVSAQSLLKEP